MVNRRSKGINVTASAEEKKAEDKARAALDSEDLGKLDTAAEYWQELLPYKTDKEHPEQRPWGLIAEKYLKSLRDADAYEGRLKSLLQSEKILDKKQEGDDEYEKLALAAQREENAGQDARASWELLKTRTADEPALRPWHLLAARKVRALTKK
jgi:hypothetical protein